MKDPKLFLATLAIIFSPFLIQYFSLRPLWIPAIILTTLFMHQLFKFPALLIFLLMFVKQKFGWEKSTFSLQTFFFANPFFLGRNDSGMFLAELLPLFLIGLFFVDVKRFFSPLLLFLLAIPANFFLSPLAVIWMIFPLLTIIIAHGFLALFSLWQKNIFGKAFVCLYLGLILYGYLNFWHYFFVHYLPIERYAG